MLFTQNPYNAFANMKYYIPEPCINGFNEEISK